MSARGLSRRFGVGRESACLPISGMSTGLSDSSRSARSRHWLLFNHAVGEQLQRVGHGKTEGCGGFEIDDKLVSQRELNGQIAWARAPQNPVNVRRCRSHQLKLIDPIGHQTPTLSIEAELT